MTELKTVAVVHNGFDSKLGLPRQSGLVEELVSTVVFEKEYRVPDALRGIEGFSHLWLLWGFHRAEREGWSPTVRPPRLGGNTRVGVFATRSPFRPNSIGMSCVRLLRVEHTAADGDVLVVAGTDMMDGTPVYDIKPYIPLADCRPEATAGFAGPVAGHRLEVSIPDELTERIRQEDCKAVRAVLAQDPRPAYQEDPERVYGFHYNGLEIRFRVAGLRLEVVGIEAT